MAGIYVHIPFCSQACHYCDFHFSTSLKTKENVITSIKKELLIEKDYLNGESICTIYFGGGTPSLLSQEDIKGLLDVISKNFSLVEDLELTIEANPEDISESKIDQWYNLGINRISLGVQSFRDKDLKYMNRSHNSRQAIKSIQVIKNSKITNISIDLIYGFPLLSNVGWIKNLEQAAHFELPHISCYCLTVEPQTPLFHFIKRKKEKPLNSETGNQQFLIARELLAQNGYEHYEISSFSKSGYHSRHNQNYWNKTKYLGVGPSAHSFNGVSRRWSPKNNNTYRRQLDQGRVIYNEEILTKKNMINEHILTSMRTSTGLNMNYIKNNLNKSELTKFNLEISKLEKRKLIKIKNTNVCLSVSGMLVADSVSQNLFLI